MSGAVLRLAAALGALAAAATLLPGCAQAPNEAPWSVPGYTRQMMVVTTDDWNASSGSLQSFERDSAGGAWRLRGDPVAVVVGRNGAAWGIGLNPHVDAGPVKREGDGRSPAGVFEIGAAFGYEPELTTRLYYRALDADDWCIDLPKSPLYNHIVNAREVGAAAVVGSSEPMRRDLHANGDPAYKLGFVIAHNPQGAEYGAGSCIFAHLWKSPTSGTAGCTAMAEAPLRDLLGWLVPDAHPVFVLLPRAEYARRAPAWQLPELPPAAQ